MAKATNGNAKIVYNGDRTVGETTTFVTVGDLRYGRKYEYPVIRFADLTIEAQERVLPYTNGDIKKADAIIEFAYRNRLAGVQASLIRATLISPSEKSMTTALRERCCDLLGAGDMNGASDLLKLVNAADHDELVELWSDHIRKNVEVDFTEAVPTD